MKKSFTVYVMLICSVLALVVVTMVLKNNPMVTSPVEKKQDEISAVQAEINELTKTRNAMQTAYNRAVRDGESIDISEEVEPLPVFLYLTEERQSRDITIANGIAKAFLSYKQLGDNRYLSATIGDYKFIGGEKLDVSHLDDVFTNGIGPNSNLAGSYKAAPYEMTSDETVSYYAVFYYNNSGSSTTCGILFDLSITKAGSIKRAVAYNVYPD